LRNAPQEIRAFFVTSGTNLRRPLFKNHEMANLFFDVLSDNRKRGRFLLHEFVAMPDHFHLILTPEADTPLEKALQYIKGGFSFRAKKELGFNSLVWQESFTNHRIRDNEDYFVHRYYIHQNPLKRGLVRAPSDYPYCSAFAGAQVDPVPPWLKPDF
jgi:putative transposase